MPDFSNRASQPEIMDNLECSGDAVAQTLRELEVINKLLGGNRVTLQGLGTLAGDVRDRALVVADLGCGGGDMLRLIRSWSEKKGLSLQLVGIDANPFITAFAKRHTPANTGIEFHTMDILSDTFSAKRFDIVTGTLFFHHFSDEVLVSFFSGLRSQVRVGIVINDIHRHWFAYYAIRALTFLFSKSSMVKHDAPLSVLRAFTREELIAIMKRSGFERFTVRWRWAFRWQVIAWTPDNLAHFS